MCGEMTDPSFYDAIASITHPAEAKKFFQDIATPAELQAFSDRWLAYKHLREGKSFRAISQQTGISVTTIGRVSRCMTYGSGGYEAIYNQCNNGVKYDN